MYDGGGVYKVYQSGADNVFEGGVYKVFFQCLTHFFSRVKKSSSPRNNAGGFLNKAQSTLKVKNRNMCDIRSLSFLIYRE